jgi:hypothetical protein
VRRPCCRREGGLKEWLLDVVDLAVHELERICASFKDRPFSLHLHMSGEAELFTGVPDARVARCIRERITWL